MAPLLGLADLQNNSQTCSSNCNMTGNHAVIMARKILGHHVYLYGEMFH